MAARIPRRTFLTPFVITIGACSPTSAPAPTPAPTPAPQPSPSVVANPPPRAPVVDAAVAANSPPPPPPPERSHLVDAGPLPTANPPAPHERSWTVQRLGNRCIAIENGMCSPVPAGQPVPPCNPPPARDYKCTPAITATNVLHVVQSSDGRCQAMPDMTSFTCPPGATCNPPSPYIVPCPV